MYDEAQEKLKDKKVEERFFFRIVKSKKRKPKQEPSKGLTTAGSSKLFDVKKYVVPNSSSSNKELPSSGSDGSETGEDNKKDSSNQSMRSRSEEPRETHQQAIESKHLTEPKKALDYSLTKKLFNIVKKTSTKEKPAEPIQ